MNFNPWLRIFLPFAVGYFLSYLLRNANAVIAPALTMDLSLSASSLGLLTASYLLAFGAFQLPLGILLDRYGARRVEAGLLLIAASGCLLFASGGNLGTLTLARGLIGLGVSACLMASFKAFSLFFDQGRQASLNAAVMAAGAMGALFATSPLAFALPLLGWRGIYFALGVLVILAAIGIWSTPEKSSTASNEPFRVQVAAVAAIFRHRAYWAFSLQTMLIVGGFMAIQGLWAVPWLIEVNSYSRAVAAWHLTGASLGMALGLLIFLGIILQIGFTFWLWLLQGMVFSVGNLAYALLGRHFPLHLSGRVNTALNLAAFVGAFGLQWGIGLLIDILQFSGWSLHDALRGSFSCLFLAQAASHYWFVRETRQLSPLA